MAIAGTIRRGEYFDSVSLMLAAREIGKLDGAEDAAVVMGTAENRAILEASGMLCPAVEGSGDTDLLIVVKAATDEDATRLLTAAEARLASFRKQASPGGTSRPRSLDGALAQLPGANLALISVAGRYAGDLARQALERGLHVMLFSDNVSLEDEIALKRQALARGLLVMGPDCGTAILNGVPLGFANAGPRGSIGMVAAAGTGLQEVSCLVFNAGAGVSQAIGTGGRDVKEKVGGMMFEAGIHALLADDATRVLLLVSKPPHPAVLARLRTVLEGATKPVVTCFLGATGAELAGMTGHHAATLEEAALLAVALTRDAGARLPALRQTLAARDADAFAGLDAARARRVPGRRYLRGLFSGGTFCYEAQILCRDVLPGLHANAPAAGVQGLASALRSEGHTVVDLGEDEFTVGRPHPMIDYSLRNRRILEETRDPETAVILLDVVLGYGSHADPAAELAPVLKEVHGPVVVCSVTGTDGDPQGRGRQIEALHAAGALVFPSNAAACRAALEVLR